MNTDTARKYRFETGVYRPPSEGGSYSLLLRVTRNCPWNKCTFCGMYKEEKFAIRSVEEIKGDIDAVAAVRDDLRAISMAQGHGGGVTRDAVLELIRNAPDLNFSHGIGMVLDWLHSGGKTAFLQDANSPVMKTENLVAILKHLRSTFPSLERVTSYARSKTIARKSPEELKAICEAGLDRLHVGLETGDPDLLKQIKKGSAPEDHITGGKKAMAAGYQLSEYWMPGLGGKNDWKAHAKGTARVLNAIDPHYIRSRPFFPHPGTPLFDDYQSKDKELLSPREQLVELRLMVEELEVTSKVCFDHAGNHWTGRDGRTLFSLSYEGYKFPEEKERVLGLIDEGIEVQEKSPTGPPAWLTR
ncbi:MAG: radical SAM protein [Deltaproteobacteria bacterium]|nr:radical SAM protein [Deltaproteobacteria bacterium]